jgi:hypothetical protein
VARGSADVQARDDAQHAWTAVSLLAVNRGRRHSRAPSRM